jgi:hypothetical protein
MDEEISAAVIGLDKAESLGCIKPFTALLPQIEQYRFRSCILYQVLAPILVDPVAVATEIRRFTACCGTNSIPSAFSGKQKAADDATR